MNCKKCDKKFNVILDSCGTGSTWSLLKCGGCGQLHAFGNIIPKDVSDDKDIITTNS